MSNPCYESVTMSFPKEKKQRSTVIRIPEGLDEAIIEFLQTEKAKRSGFRYKGDVVQAAVRDMLIRYGFIETTDSTREAGEERPEQGV